MNKFGTELAKFIYCILVGFAAVLLLAFFVDLVSYLVAGEWRWELGVFPAVSGTFRALRESGFFYTFCLLIALGMFARFILHDRIPFFLREKNS